MNSCKFYINNTYIYVHEYVVSNAQHTKKKYGHSNMVLVPTLYLCPQHVSNARHQTVSVVIRLLRNFLDKKSFLF